jgi:DNA repair protein RadC
MKIREIPWFDRPWTRLKEKGVSNLSNAELLAAVLGRGNKKENAIDLSHRVLSKYHFNSLSNLSLSELEVEFKNDIQAMRIQAMFEILRRTNRLEKNGYKKKIKTAEDVFNYFVDTMKDKKKEYFYALLLDTKNQIISNELISVGTLNSSLIHPREVFNPAIKASSNSIILVHNHPSGDCTPSFEDKEITKILLDAGKMLGVSLLDHVIIGNFGFSSYNENEWF